MEFISIKEIETLLKLGAFEFNPTQSKLCLPIIQRIHRKMALGVEFESINVKDNLLINGHHRYICSLLLQKVISTQAWVEPVIYYCLQMG